MPRISIIVPLYKAEKYIEQCLQAFSRQEFKDFEVVMIDDCSPDNSLEVAKACAKELGLNAVFVKNEQNLGPSRTRENGIKEANGEYLAFCDSDDYYSDDYLALMATASENFTKDVVFCSYNAVYSSGKSVVRDLVSKIKDKTKKEILAHGTDSLCALMVKKSVLNGIEFPDIRNGEDMAIIPLIIALSNSFGYVDKPIYNYVYHENSLSKKPNADIVPVLEKSFNYVAEHIEKDYPEETEFLGIKNLLYGATLNLLKSPRCIKKARALYKSFKSRYPKWKKNKYYSFLPKYKKIYLWFLGKKMFVACRVLSSIHRIISK